MKVTAWVWNEPCEPIALQLTEREIAAPQPGEVVIENKAVALNPVDWKLVRSKNNNWKPGHIPGVDGAGVVVACGEHTNVPLGTRVAYHHDLNRDGSFSTHTVIAAKAMLRIPESVSFRDAATMPCPGMTGWQALNKFPVVADRDVLITGGASATGTYMIQLAVSRGYRVWTTASGKNHARLLELGAEGVFDYHDSEWREALMRGLEGWMLYAAIDNVGAKHAEMLAPLINYNGHLVSICGRVAAPPLPAFTTVISLHEIALGAIHQYGRDHDWATLRESAAEILNGLAAGTMKTPPIETFEFGKLNEALESLRTGTQQGKLIAEM